MKPSNTFISATGGWREGRVFVGLGVRASEMMCSINPYEDLARSVTALSVSPRLFCLYWHENKATIFSKISYNSYNRNNIKEICGIY